MGWFNKYLVGFSEAYPEINAIVKSNEYVLSGRLRTIDEAGEEWGNYDVEIVFSSQYPKVLPKLYERSNKLGKTVNNHFFLDDGSCCYGWNTEVHLYLKSDFSFKNLIDTAIMPFFLQQDFKRATNGEFYREYKRHDKLDAIIFYQDYFDVPYFKMALDAMQQVIKGRAPNNYCFCGKKVNGLSIKNVSCTAHTQKVKELIKHCGKEMIKADFEMIVEELKKKNKEKKYDMIKFDDYSLRARIFPTLIMLSPLIMIAIWELNMDIKNKLIVLTFIVFAILFRLSSWVGKKGRDIQPKLFKTWGGKPTTEILKEENNYLDRIKKQILKENLAKKIKMSNIELNEDETYDEYCSYCKNKTRDKQQYPVIYDKLVVYGFYRNLFAMKPIGWMIFIASLLVVIYNLYINNWSFETNKAIVLLYLVFYISFLVNVTKKKLFTYAYDYAEHLYLSFYNI